MELRFIGISYLPLINQVGIVYIFLYFLKHIRTKNMDIILHINSAKKGEKKKEYEE